MRIAPKGIWGRKAAAFLAAVLTSAVFPAFFATPVIAEVEKVEILSREPFAGGMEFGDVGAYEKIKGRLYYAVDPSNQANSMIVDLKYAPRDKRGLVVFSGDFILLKPIDLARGNHRLLYDVNNRGNLVMLGSMNDAAWSNDPTLPEDAGNGFLMRQGYSLLWSAWNWDVTPGNGRLQIELPVATIDGKPIRQKIAAEIVLSFENSKVGSQPLAWGNSRCYPALNPDNNSGAVLTVRDEPRGERRLIPNSQWRFAREENGQVIADPSHLYLESGFEPGRIYELIYEVEGPRVVGLGLAAVRDAISFFHFESRDRMGTTNPLAVKTDGDGLKPDSQFAYIFGVSQSGRFITHMIWQGFHVDEAGRMVFEGARIHVAGGGKGGFNHRFAQTTHHPSHLEGNYMPADHMPFNYLPEDDPGSMGENDVLATAKRLGKVPFIMITNNALEYWTRSASLIHTDIAGAKDAALHEKVRIYMTNGAPHRAIGNRDRMIFEHSLNPINVSPVLRALMVAMDDWVSAGIEPPASRYPRIDRGELISPTEHKIRFPAIPGMRHPGRNLQPPRVNYGDRFWSEGVITIIPPEMGEPYITLVPAFDADGNGIGGIRLPELTVPLGTYQGWNPRRAEFNAPDYLGRFEGSFWAFPLTEAERKEAGDPRDSIEKRYSGKADYIAKVRKAVAELVAMRYMLAEDAYRYIAQVEGLVWPPEMIQQRPFWNEESK
jgi:hypothetical protein